MALLQAQLLDHFHKNTYNNKKQERFSIYKAELEYQSVTNEET